jgi:hypothetical protein
MPVSTVMKDLMAVILMEIITKGVSPYSISGVYKYVCSVASCSLALSSACSVNYLWSALLFLHVFLMFQNVFQLHIYLFIYYSTVVFKLIALGFLQCLYPYWMRKTARPTDSALYRVLHQKIKKAHESLIKF